MTQGRVDGLRGGPIARGLPPATGAVLQEGIDVAVILNALRALLPGRGGDGAASMTGRAA